MRWLIVLALLLAPVQSISAQIEVATDYSDSVVQVINGNSRGSGTVVKFIKDCEEYPEYYIGLVLTAAHVIDGEENLLDVKFSNGKKTTKNTAVISLEYKNDPYNDIGLIRVLIPDEILPIPVGTNVPQIGEKVFVAGYGTRKYRGWDGDFGGRAMLSGDGLIIFSWAIQGDSGGPIIHDGKIIGVICRGTAVGMYGDTNRYVIAPIHGSSVKRVINFIKLYSA